MTSSTMPRSLPITLGLGALIVATALIGMPPTPAAAADDPDTVGAVDVSQGLWRLRTEEGLTATFYYGNPGDLPFAGDWNCNGIDTPGLYRQSDGYVYLRNSNTQGVADIAFFFGNPGDIPIAGDFDGDGCDTVSIYRPSEGRVFVINELGSADDGLGPADYDYYFGNPADTPFSGDFTGDAISTVGLYRETAGLTFLRYENASGPADVSFYFGDPGDLFVAGDWNANGVETSGVFRPSDATFYLKNTNTEGNADSTVTFGSPQSMPVAGRWGDVAAEAPLAFDHIVGGLNQPLFLTAPPGDDRLFVLEKGGAIRIIDDGVVLQNPFLSINVSSSSERGLLGMAFHPNYAANGRFFVHYTNPAGDTRVVEYFATPGANTADPAPKQTLLSVQQDAGNHNGGMLEFGPNGHLLVALGDGGSDPRTSQDPYDVLGSILRLDVDKVAPNNGAVGNPYATGGGDPRIWAIGLRNPWRFSYDAISNALFIGDVGQERREEVNVNPMNTGGLNFGWNQMEGSLCYPIGSNCSSSGLTLPVAEYGRDVGRSITGGYVYRGSDLEGLDGTYFYGDFVTGAIWSFRYDGGSVVHHIDRTPELGPLSPLSSFGVDGFGELYAVTLNGNVYRMVVDS
ncbi:MAG: PQQ-dependent sugar dehydrogenase [Acidimicrobiia bacterium]